MPTFIESQLSSQTLIITLNNPKALNALNATLLKELDELLQEGLGNPSVRGIIITGQGEKAFAAGADISEFLTMGQTDAETLSKEGNAIFGRIERATKPVIAAVNGYALGGGCELALACHIRLASENALFGQPEVKLGIIPGYGGSQRLPRLIGRGKAIEMIITGNPINATVALEWGLVNEVCPQSKLIDRCLHILSDAYKNSPLAIAYALEACQTSQVNDNHIQVEEKLFGLAMASEDAKEGISAFLEKRKPNFSGK